jgi:Calcineurin-like phosphoesterase
MSYEWDLPAAPRIIAIGDLHGDMKRLNDILRFLQIINDRMEWIAEPCNTIVVQLGDQIDSKCRDPNCDWETTPDIRLLFYMDHLDTLAQEHGGRVISLIGNHEVMNMVGDFSYVSDKSMNAFAHPKVRHVSFQPGGYIAKKYLSKRPLILKIGDILFCHGGILFQHWLKLSKMMEINDIFRRYCLKQPLLQEEIQLLLALVFDSEGIVWTRKYMEFYTQRDHLTNTSESIHTDWNYFLYVLKLMECSKVVTGHNTVPQISIVDGKIFLIDTGLSRAFGTNSFQILEFTNTNHNSNPETKIVNITYTEK